MRRLIVFLFIAVAGWQGYTRYLGHVVAQDEVQSVARETTVSVGSAARNERPASESAREFRCDGRIHCSQMTSCDEATFFLKNCPGTKMDGDHDGVPCEQQWCG